jgi:hypothetical protein
MDKKELIESLKSIISIQKDTKKLEKKEKDLLKEDHARDKVCDYGKKQMKKNKGK